jgi:uncharacterized FAD-dependent dehydrogenase
MGFRPIILDRGKVVRERTKDTWGLWRRGVLNPESNVQFGEGGAGTFSDGKLYSRIKDPRHLDRKVLTEFVKAGAPPEILTEAHPHIGTFRLVAMVESLRETIEGLGGEYRFSHTASTGSTSHTDGAGERRVRGSISKRRLSRGRPCRARDRPQRARHLRDAPRRGRPCRGQALLDRGAHRASAIMDRHVALRRRRRQSDPRRRRISYLAPLQEWPHGLQLLHVPRRHRRRRDVGGRPRRHQRHEPIFAQRAQRQFGLVVAIDPARDYPGDPLAGLALQRHWESLAYVAGGSNYKAPAQRVGDFLAGRPSSARQRRRPPIVPGVTPTDLAACLPDFAVEAMREAIPVFGRQIAGYDHPDVVMTGVETRTSSPVRFTRGDDFQSLNTAGLFPAGEGAGYAGGILSAAVDGIKVAEAVAQSVIAGRTA